MLRNVTVFLQEHNFHWSW